MALQFFQSVQGLQVKRDHDFSNLTLECDAVPVYPAASTRHVERNPGKIAVEIDVCDLEVAKLIVHGVAEICDIICPEDFNLTAGQDINQTAGQDINQTAGRDIDQTAARSINLTAQNDIRLSTPSANGDIIITTAGAGAGSFLNLFSDDEINLDTAAGGIVQLKGAGNLMIAVTAGSQLGFYGHPATTQQVPPVVADGTTAGNTITINGLRTALINLGLINGP